MFERYNEAARRVLFFSRYESSQLGAVSIETEHLLLGLVRDGSALLTQIPLERLRRELESHRTSAERTPTSVEIPFGASAKRALQFAAEEADRLLHTHIGPEHLLLGLLREEQSVAASALAAHGVRLSEVRRKVEGRPASLDRAAVTRLACERIKTLVEELARAPRDSPEAAALVTRILSALDALRNEDGT
jgi:ATP-dependent Clp protease ATP-binding subunit ClpC